MSIVTIAKPPADADVDLLAALIDRRDTLSEECCRLGKIEAELAAAEFVVAQIDAAERALDEIERGALDAWSQTSTGEPPPPLRDERRQLAQRRALAVSDARSAALRRRGVQRRLDEIAVEMRGIGFQIYQHRLASVLAELPVIEERILAAQREENEQLSRLRALFIVLGEEKANAMNLRDEPRAILLQDAIGKIEGLKRTPIAADYTTQLAIAGQWRQRLK